MTTVFKCSVIILIVPFFSAFLISHGNPSATWSGPEARPLRFTILYDNYRFNEKTRPDWGFSCLVEGGEKTILFDTGTRPEILMHNAEVLGVDWTKVELIVISHNHGDHTGGLPAVLKKNPRVSVFFPVSFPPEFRTRVEGFKAQARPVERPLTLGRNVYLTGEVGDRIKEQSLILDTPAGLVVVTGCSHPGIVNILRRAREVVDRPIYLVFGGFHLGDKSEAEIKDIIAAFRELKVERCGATHCTGERAIALFKRAFGEDFVSLGTGRVFEVQGF
jgi:7,8-dihydropterin-6-yl-methyl-4-(beta-D-ribofuranosyl)aminobenzene 5'-phosphate synthase